MIKSRPLRVCSLRLGLVSPPPSLCKEGYDSGGGKVSGDERLFLPTKQLVWELWAHSPWALWVPLGCLDPCSASGQAQCLPSLQRRPPVSLGPSGLGLRVPGRCRVGCRLGCPAGSHQSIHSQDLQGLVVRFLFCWSNLTNFEFFFFSAVQT